LINYDETAAYAGLHAAVFNSHVGCFLWNRMSCSAYLPSEIK